MLYAIVVGLGLTLAALFAEQGARLTRRASRGIWLVAMVLTMALPLLAGVDTEPAPAVPPSYANNAAETRQAAASPGRGAWLPVHTVRAAGVDIDLDRVARLAWLASSALALAAIAGASVALHRRRRAWQEGDLAGMGVLVSVDAGPAVVGMVRARIVVPRWLLEADAGRQALVLAHEQAHVDAGDQRLLAVLMLLAAVMPWNLPLWFQLHRARRAIEVDCDARVLRQGHRVADYGAALIDIGSHAAQHGHLAHLSPLMAESAGFLEQRVRLMVRRPTRWQRLAGSLALMVSFDIGVAAARIAPPQGLPPSAAVAVAQPLRDALAGYYDLGANRVAVVAATDDGLSMKTNLEPLWRLRPAAADRYFLPGTPLQVRFDRNAGTLAVNQFGAEGEPAPRVDSTAVERADAYIAARVASGQALPGGADIVRRNVGATDADQLHADDFTPGFLRQARAQMAQQHARHAAYGKVEDIAFAGVNRWGWDRYTVRYANRTVTWAIWLDGEGRLAAAVMDAPP